MNEPYLSAFSKSCPQFIQYTMFRLVLLSCLISGIYSLVINPRADQLEWTALGDSYASGVGSTDYVDGRRCLRYNEAYPVQLNNDSELSAGDHIFNNVPCSGALAAEIAEWQLLDEKKDTGPSWQYGTHTVHDPAPR